MTFCIEEGDARAHEGGTRGQFGDEHVGEPGEGSEEGGTRPDAGDEGNSPHEEKGRDGPLGNFPTRRPGIKGDERIDAGRTLPQHVDAGILEDDERTQ